MSINDALMESYRVYGWGYVLNHPVPEEKTECASNLRRWLHGYCGGYHPHKLKFLLLT